MAATNFDNINSFPSESASPETKKSFDYIIEYGKAMYNKWKYADGGYATDNKRILLNRKYAEGMQSVDKYKNRFSMDNGETAYLNLDWSIVPIIPKYVDLWVGEMINEDLQIQCEAIDPTSRIKKDEERRRLIANMKLKSFSEFMVKEAGIHVIPEGEFIPEDQEELELHMQLKSKLATEIAMEESLEFELADNNWVTAKGKILRDLAVIKKSAVKCYFDENQRIKFRWVDWANLITPFSVQDNLSDLRYCGEVIKVPLHELRRMAKGELSDEDLFKIARAYAGEDYGNRQWSYGESFHRYYAQSPYGEYDDFLIDVLDFSFISINTEVYAKKSTAYGGYYFNKKKYNYNAPKDSETKVDLTKKPLEYAYKGHWVIGTNYLFDYGLQEDILRNKKHGKISPKAFLPFLFIDPQQYDMKNKSLVERMMPHADTIQLLHLKIQQLLAKLTPPGQAIDVNALKDVVLGKGKEWTPLELQELYSQTGVYYYNGEDEEGRPMNRRPIEEIRNSMGQTLQELIGMYNFEIQQIRDVTGLNEIRDASMPDKEAAVGISQMALIGSRNTTRPLSYAFRELFEALGKRLALMIQYNIGLKRNLEIYSNVIGKHNIKMLDLTKDFKLAEMGIIIKAQSDEQERLVFETNLQQSLAQKELRIEDAIMLREIPNTKLANQYMSLRRRKYAQERLAEDQARIQTQMQEAQQASVLKQQEEQATIQAKAVAEMTVEETRLQADIEREKVKHLNKMEELKLQGDFKSQHIKMASEEDFKNTALSSGMRQPKVFTGPSTGTSTSIEP